jgi:cellulose biosynthesis protein BcsQ
VVIAAPKGGVGKSSLSVSLASFAARELHPRGARVALVDTNFQQSDVGKYLGQYQPNVLDLIRNPGGLTMERIGTFLLQPPGTDLSVLLGPPSAADADPAVINAALYRKILHVLREIYGVIFVDTPVAEFYHELFSQLVLPKADYILVPVEPNRVTLEDTKGWLTAITAPRHTGGGGVDRNKIALVLNRARAGVNCDPEDVQDIMSGWRFAGMIPDSDEWQAAINRGQLGDLQKLRDLDTVFRHILALATDQPGLFQDDGAPPQRKGGLRHKFGLKR